MYVEVKNYIKKKLRSISQYYKDKNMAAYIK